MKHRKLRIAWSVAWGIVAVLLVALWVRSYWRLDTLSPSRTTNIDNRLQSASEIALSQAEDIDLHGHGEMQTLFDMSSAATYCAEQEFGRDCVFITARTLRRSTA